MKKGIGVTAVLLSVFLLGGCMGMKSTMGDMSEEMASPSVDDMADMSGENFRYESIVEQGFKETEREASSYFSLDRNTASYSQVRAQLKSGRRVMPESVRTEELINYFDYSFPAPAEGELMRATGYLSDCPWNAEHELLSVGIRTEEKTLAGGRNNYVLLVDVSGSMSGRVEGLEGMTVLDLVKFGAEKLVSGLTEHDSVSIVTYASGVQLRLKPTLADKNGKRKIEKAVDALSAYGSTNGSGGLQLAYEQAEKNFSADGNNRVILMTDGDFNVGYSSVNDLKEFIQEKAKSGVYLSVLGFGMGNMRDDLMQTLALNGNGNYAYIDAPEEAEKALGRELLGMLVPVAKDAKANVTFRPEAVKRYRLLGYDMKLMSESDFENSETDAGEIGSNLTVVAVYEIERKEEGDLLAEAKVRFKTVEDEEKEISVQIGGEKTASDELTFIGCVAEFSLVLRQSEYRGSASLDSVLARLNALSDYLEADSCKSGFVELVRLARENGGE